MSGSNGSLAPQSTLPLRRRLFGIWSVTMLKVHCFVSFLLTELRSFVIEVRNWFGRRGARRDRQKIALGIFALRVRIFAVCCSVNP